MIGFKSEQTSVFSFLCYFVWWSMIMFVANFFFHGNWEALIICDMADLDSSICWFETSKVSIELSTRFFQLKNWIPGVNLCLLELKCFGLGHKSKWSVTFDRKGLLTSSFDHSNRQILSFPMVKTRGQKLFPIKSYNQSTVGLQTREFEF